ncbi:MAG: response regulator [Betaproteobacteria bacterium]
MTGDATRLAQVDQTLERPQAGLGVGLTLARRRVEMHGGTLEGMSDGPARGSRFVVRVPQVASPERAAAPVAAHTEEVATSGHRILIVDDNRDFAASLAAILRVMGNDVRVANDGAARLALARSFIPDLAFLDIGMPMLNGYDLAMELRKLASLVDCLLVAVTGWGQERDRAQARDAGFDHHLIKPVDPGDVIAILRARRLTRLA